jgi:hypothetical protein
VPTKRCWLPGWLPGFESDQISVKGFEFLCSLFPNVQPGSADIQGDGGPAPWVPQRSAGETMYTIEKKIWGIKLTFGGAINKEDIDLWFKESQQVLATCRGRFGVIVDMRTTKPLTPEVQAVILQGQDLYRRAGMERSAVILDSPLMTMQTMRLSKLSGIYAFERYIDASSDGNWQEHAEAWVNSGIDPDK